MVLGLNRNNYSLKKLKTEDYKMTLVKFNNKTRNTAPYFNNVFDSLFSEALEKNWRRIKIPSEFTPTLDDIANTRINIFGEKVRKYGR